MDRATNHQPQGRQSAVDKKWGQNPVKETADRLAKPAGKGDFPSGSRTAWPPNKKPQFPYSRELRSAPVLLGPQAGGRPVSREPVRPSYRQVSGSWINLLPAPSQGLHQPQWPSAGFVPNYSGGTATVFHRLPSSPMGPVSFSILFFLAPGVKGNHQVPSPGPGRTPGRLSPPPGPGPRGRIWPGGETRPGGRIGDSWSRSVPCPWPR